MTARSSLTPSRPSRPALLGRLIGAYLVTSIVATVGGAALFGFGLDFTPRQVGIGLCVLAPLALASVISLDLWAIRRALRPVGAYLDAPQNVGAAASGAALVRAINLPVLTFLRVMLLHGPAAAVTITLASLWLNRVAAFGLTSDQLVVLWLLILFVSVGHAFMEYFLVADVVRPVVHAMRVPMSALEPEARRRIIPVPMRRTLFAVSFFVVFVPLLFLAASLLAKVVHLLEARGVPGVATVMLPLYGWAALLIGVSMVVVLLMASMTAREVMRAAHEMAEGMARVERDEFDDELVVTTASEFAGLYEGFNRMSGRLRALIETREHRAAELSELQSREHFRRLVENGSDLILVLNAQGSIEYQSPAVGRILGGDPGRFTGRRLGDLVHPDDVGRWAEVLESHRVAAPAAGRPIEIRVPHADGGWRTLEAIVQQTADRSGERTVFVVNARDVTDRRREEDARKELESRLVQWQKMESIGRLAGGIAHDFNNLLAVVSGRCQILTRGAPDATALRRGLEIIQTAADKGALLTRQLLAFSRKQVLQPEVLELDRVVGETMALVTRVLQEDIRVAFHAGATGAGVRCDQGQLTQVILNLATNARDAMPNGGTLTISTGDVEVDPAMAVLNPGTRAGRFVTLSVRDTGVGMDKDLRAVIFEPFFTTKGLGRGTGLGLATVYGIVAQGGGFVSVDGAPGTGSTFVVHLPRVELVAGEQRGPSPLPSPPGVETILLVEDEPEVRAVVRELLEEGGYHVLEAPGGPQALELADHHRGPIHLLITDVVMPQMSGRQLADLLTSRQPGLPVLFMSGHTDDALVHHGFPGDSRAFIQKPFALDELARRVRQGLGPPAADAA